MWEDEPTWFLPPDYKEVDITANYIYSLYILHSNTDVGNLAFQHQNTIIKLFTGFYVVDGEEKWNHFEYWQA